MKLQQIFSNVESGELVRGITNDSRVISKGMIFVAIKGQFSDGHDYLSIAKEKGAIAAVVSEVNHEIDLIQIPTKHPISEMARVASLINGTQESEQIFIGVTGTDGKTTTASLIQEFLAPEVAVGYIGTSGITYGDVSLSPQLTTPMPDVLHETFRHMREKNVGVVAMEVSSHAQVLGRSDYIPFDIAIFTNLSHDHLDFHHTMDAYFNAKAKIFANLDESGFAIINGDDAYGKMIDTKARKIYYGFEENNDIVARNIKYGPKGTEFTLSIFKEEFQVTVKLVADFNVQNILAIVSLAKAIGMDNQSIINKIATLKPVKGRMQLIDCGQEFTVLIDMAHAPNSMTKVLEFLNETKQKDKKLYCVFGCAGDRDKEKRPVMMGIGTALADYAIITEDDPHSERVEAIVSDMIQSNKDTNFEIILNREEAIKKAIKLASAGDIVAILGRGSEEEIPRHDETIKFSDIEFTSEYLNKLKV